VIVMKERARSRWTGMLQPEKKKSRELTCNRDEGKRRGSRKTCCYNSEKKKCWIIDMYRFFNINYVMVIATVINERMRKSKTCCYHQRKGERLEI
jgi:hypothetical protein